MFWHFTLVDKTSLHHIPYLDGWRGVAILAVLAGHFGNQRLLSWLGGFGVQVFFVLSGYLMCHLLFVKRVALADFFIRRFTRVLPTFFLFVGTMFVYASWLQPVTYAVSSGELLSTLTFLRTYLPAELNIKTGNWAIGHLWSLNVEEHTYVFLALIAIVTSRFKTAHLACLCLVLSAAAALAFNVLYAAAPPSGASPWSARTECAAFAIIAAAALRLVRETHPHLPLHRLPAFVPILAFILAMACFAIYAHKNLQFMLAPLCLALVINYLDRVPALLREMLSWKPLRWFGQCSFSLYLWQQPVYIEVSAGRLSMAAGLVLALALGILSFYLFEDPLRRSLNAAWAARKALTLQDPREAAVHPVQDFEQPQRCRNAGQV